MIPLIHLDVQAVFSIVSLGIHLIHLGELNTGDTVLQSFWFYLTRLYLEEPNTAVHGYYNVRKDTGPVEKKVSLN